MNIDTAGTALPLPESILLTNDDGIDAPGLSALHEAIGLRGSIIAPSTVQSGCSHLVTMERHIVTSQRSETAWSVTGSPGDCVRLGLQAFAPETRYVLSGINEGANLGHDIYLSGTVAAAREAAFHRVPAIAISQYVLAGHQVDWSITVRLAQRAIAAALQQPLKSGEFWNINLPHVLDASAEPAIIFCERCREALPLAYDTEEEGYLYRRGLYHSRKRCPGTDVDVCFGGDIAITRLEI